MHQTGLAKTTFFTGPDDTLAVVDTYKKETSTVINSIQEIDESETSDLTIDAKRLLPAPYVKPDLEDMDPEIMSMRLGEQDNKLKGLFNDLSSKVKNSITVSKGTCGLLKSATGDSAFKILPKNISDVSSIVKVMAQLTKGGYPSNLKDLGAMSGLITTLASQGSKMGLPDVFSTLASVSGGLTDKLALLSSAKSLVTESTKTGNLGLFLDVSKTSVAKDVGKAIPDGVKNMIGGFKLPESLEQKDMSGYYDKARTGFDIVNAGWKTVSRNGSPSLSGVTLSGATDFLKLVKAKAFSAPVELPTAITVALKSPAEDEKFLLLMEKYKSTDVGTNLKTMLPTVKIKVNPPFDDYNFNDPTTLVNSPTTQFT